jgi:hypothetical protein
MIGSMRPSLLVLALALAGCGRFGFGDDEAEPIPLVAEDTLAPWPQAICPRRGGGGFAVAFAHLPPDATAPELVVVETDAVGHPAGDPIALGELERWLDYVRVFPTDDGYVVFHSLRDTGGLSWTSWDGSEIRTGDYGSRSSPSVTRLSTGYAVGYQSRNAMDVDEARVEILDALEPTSTSNVTLAPGATESQASARTAQSGDVIGTLWGADGGTWFAPLSADGAMLGPAVRLASGGRGSIHADDEGGFVVSWFDESWNVSRIDAAGTATWSEPVALPPNLRESQDFDFGVSDRLIAMAWQSDDRSDFNQVEGAFAPLTAELASPVVERQMLSVPEGSFCCPTVVAVGATTAVAFQGTWRNRRAAFIRLMQP